MVRDFCLKQSFSDLGKICGEPDSFLERLDVAHRAAVPGDVLAEASRGAFFTVIEGGEFEVAKNDSQFFSEKRLRTCDASCQQCVGLPKNPRRTQCAAADHHARAVRCAHECRDMFRQRDIAVTKDWNVWNSFNHATNRIPIGAA